MITSKTQGTVSIPSWGGKAIPLFVHVKDSQRVDVIGDDGEPVMLKAKNGKEYVKSAKVALPKSEWSYSLVFAKSASETSKVWTKGVRIPIGTMPKVAIVTVDGVAVKVALSAAKDTGVKRTYGKSALPMAYGTATIDDDLKVTVQTVKEGAEATSLKVTVTASNGPSASTAPALASNPFA